MTYADIATWLRAMVVPQLTRSMPESWHDPLLVFMAVTCLGVSVYILIVSDQLVAPRPDSYASRPLMSLPFLPAIRSGPQLLGSQELNALIWNVDQVEDVGALDIDIERTVYQTAYDGGLPRLAYHLSSRLREVWLWLDGSAQDPTIETYCDDIFTALTRVGLTVRRGAFDGVPTEIRWDEGDVFVPDVIEGRQHPAIVAICTDGAVLSARLRQRQSHVAASVLRGLAQWQRLGFFDFSRGEFGLRAHLAPVGLRTFFPEELLVFCGLRKSSLPLPQHRSVNALRTWAACLALSPRPVSREDAYALLRRLDLQLSPWALHELTGQPLKPWTAQQNPTFLRVVGDRITCNEDSRRLLLNWLSDAEDVSSPDQRLRESTSLAKAVRFWIERLDSEAGRRRAREAIEPWTGTPAHRRHILDQSLLSLWNRPESAANQLWDARRGMESVIRERLRKYSTAASRREDAIRLPWTTASLSTYAQEALFHLGLDAEGHAKRQRPAQLGFTVGLLLGLGGTALLLLLSEL